MSASIGTVFPFMSTFYFNVFSLSLARKHLCNLLEHGIRFERGSQKTWCIQRPEEEILFVFSAPETEIQCAFNNIIQQNRKNSLWL